MRVRSRIAAGAAAVALSLGSLLFAVGTASALSCRQVMHHSYYESHYNSTFDFYKELCDNGYYYGVMTGKSGTTDTISVSSTSDPVGGRRYNILSGHLSTTTNMIPNNGNAFVCFQTFSGFQWGCYNEYSGGPVRVN